MLKTTKTKVTLIAIFVAQFPIVRISLDAIFLPCSGLTRGFVKKFFWVKLKIFNLKPVINGIGLIDYAHSCSLRRFRCRFAS